VPQSLATYPFCSPDGEVEGGTDSVGETLEQIVGLTLARGPTGAVETTALPGNRYDWRIMKSHSYAGKSKEAI
jgi:hypothetical protein